MTLRASTGRDANEESKNRKCVGPIRSKSKAITLLSKIRFSGETTSRPQYSVLRQLALFDHQEEAILDKFLDNKDNMLCGGHELLHIHYLILYTL